MNVAPEKLPSKSKFQILRSRVWIPLCGLLLAFFYILLWQPPPYVVRVGEVKTNCFDLLDAISAYKQKHKKLPSSWKSVVQSLENPVDSTNSWISEKVVHDRREALDFAIQASPGQVVYCPLNLKGEIVDFFIMGVDERNELVADTTEPLVLTKEKLRG